MACLLSLPSFFSGGRDDLKRMCRRSSNLPIPMLPITRPSGLWVSRRQPGNYPETGFEEVGQIGNDKSASAKISKSVIQGLRPAKLHENESKPLHVFKV